MASGELLKELFPAMHKPRLVSAVQDLIPLPSSNSCFRPSSVELQNKGTYGRNLNGTINKIACQEPSHLCVTEYIPDQARKVI